MFDSLTEQHGRRLVSALRAFTVDRNPWSGEPDAFLACPLLVAEAHAAASVIEYLIDTEGVEGLATYRGLLHLRASVVPQAWDAALCECPVCVPGSTAYRKCRTTTQLADSVPAEEFTLPAPVSARAVALTRDECEDRHRLHIVSVPTEPLHRPAVA